MANTVRRFGRHSKPEKRSPDDGQKERVQGVKKKIYQGGEVKGVKGKLNSRMDHPQAPTETKG